MHIFFAAAAADFSSSRACRTYPDNAPARALDRPLAEDLTQDRDQAFEIRVRGLTALDQRIVHRRGRIADGGKAECAAGAGQTVDDALQLAARAYAVVQERLAGGEVDGSAVAEPRPETLHRIGHRPRASRARTSFASIMGSYGLTMTSSAPSARY